MALGTMRQTVFPDTNMTLFQAAINTQFSTIAQIPFIQGNSIQTLNLTAGANTVQTGLGRACIGYLVFSNTANTVIWNNDIPTSNTGSNNISIILNCSVNTTITIWIF